MNPHRHIYRRVRPGSGIMRCTICNSWKFASDYVRKQGGPIVGIPATTKVTHFKSRSNQRKET